MDEEVKQLVEMGATSAQARAALKRYKDVMQAAEHIFDGAFDDVVDDDGDVVMVSSASSGTRGRLATPEDDEDGPDTTGDSDDEGDDEDYVDYDSDFEVKQDTSRPQTDIDPYAGIFFSKDRREEVIEVEEDPETVFIPKASEHVKLMTQSQWMKGCPEGGEQSFLFSLYNHLSQGRCMCPHDCGTSVEMRKSDFFAIYSSFPKYIEQLRGLVRQRCKGCAKEFCLACGESISTRKVEAAKAEDDYDLFHCPDLQGVILGVGLSMLEALYHDQVQNPGPDGDTKRRKTSSSNASPAPGEVDDDEDHYPPFPVQKKKLKVGTGYAGDVREGNLPFPATTTTSLGA